MVSVHDVAAYILKQKGSMTSMKLQKLVYYSQAWSLVWDEEPLFNERIEAWANGPVIKELYEAHKGRFKIDIWPQGDPDQLNDNQRSTIDSVLKFYSDKTAQWLSDLTHVEKPWNDARKGIPCGDRRHMEITLGAMAEYYSSL